MKKFFLFLFALGLTYVANAQLVVTFQVDISKLIAGGTTIAGNGMRLAGNFGTNAGQTAAVTSGLPMANWGPTDTAGRLTDLGNNVWSSTLTFPDSVVGATDTLFFKFVNGNWGSNEDNGSDDSLVQGGCAKDNSVPNGGNRILVLNSSVVSGSTYRWCYDHCVQCDGSDPLLVTGVRTVNNVSVFSLAPNPAVNKETTLMYSVSEYSPVNVSLYNVLGQSVKTFVNTNRPTGVYNQPIDLSGLNTGVYFIQLTSGSQTVTKKITL